MTLLFYFAGHGAQMGGESYLLPSKAPLLFASGASPLQREEEALSAQKVLNELDSIEPDRVFMILDACRNNPIPGERMIQSGLTRMQAFSPTVKNYVLFAAAPGQTALDRQAGQAHSPFTLALSRGLQTQGVPFIDVFEQVSEDVQKATAPTSQTPYMDGIGFEFVFKPGEPSTYVKESKVWAKTVQKNTFEAYENYTNMFENGPHFAEAVRHLYKLPSYTLPSLSPDDAVEKSRQVLASISDHDWGILETRTIAIRVFAQVTPPQLQLLAEQGDSRAQQLIGFVLETGMSIPPRLDYAEAMLWYRKAAEQGYARAQTSIGDLFTHQNGIGVNYAEAMRWYRKAADQGFALAKTRMANNYTHALGVEENPAEAMRLFREAADQGDTKAQVSMAIHYELGYAVAKDYAEAMRWYRKAADDGVVQAQTSIGLLYLKGRGVPENDVEAARWLRKAADQGDARAQGNLGALYASGKGVGQSYAEALRLLLKAADQGDRDAQQYLGDLYRTGNGVTKDVDMAMEWYGKAAEAGDRDAARTLGQMYADGDGTPVDRGKAQRWMKKAAALGDTSARDWLAKHPT